MNTVDLLVVNGTLVTMDEKRRVIEDSGVAIEGGRIVAVGTRRDIVRRFTAAPDDRRPRQDHHSRPHKRAHSHPNDTFPRTGG